MYKQALHLFYVDYGAVLVSTTDNMHQTMLLMVLPALVLYLLMSKWIDEDLRNRRGSR